MENKTNAKRLVVTKIEKNEKLKAGAPSYAVGAGGTTATTAGGLGAWERFCVDPFWTNEWLF